MNIITVSREFGSGGRELARRLAKQLGYAYYDKEIIEAIASQTSLVSSYVEQISERGIAIYPIRIGRTFLSLQQTKRTSVDILLVQKDIILNLAEKGNCVIVGRSADTILEQKKR
jgi:cytidylate kinase